MRYSKGEKIDNYTIAFPHKQGSYAETYRVKDGNGKTRFMKLIFYNKLNRWQIDDNGHCVEVEIAELLDHHTLCKCVDSGMLMIDGGQCAYIVWEFVSGETLAQRIAKDDVISVYEIKQIAKAVLSALSYLHRYDLNDSGYAKYDKNSPGSSGIVHGEVTIQNVMLNLVGGLQDLKLIDFGHARFLNQTQGKPDLNELNAFYLAPERFSGVNQVQSDIYSVGAMMYHLLYGQLPWFIDTSRVQGDKVEAILAERKERELDLPKIEVSELDDQFINCIVKALSWDVEERFQSADEFIRAIGGEIKVERQSTKRKILSNSKEKKDEKKATVNVAKGPGFAAIAGMEDLKQMMREEVIDVLRNPEEYAKYGLTIPNGMLLWGPPGCGKSFFAKHFAEEIGFNFMCITPATLKSRYVNASPENIARMFKDAEENAPTIIFIDEMNELVPNRDSDVHEMSRSAVNEMLAQMDRTGEKGIFIVGATNYPNMIDPAILRAGRLDKKYYLGVPDKTARAEMFRLYLKDRPYDFGLDYEMLADKTENYVSADIKLLVDEASRMALKQRSKITMAILLNVIDNTKPSLSVNELSKYARIKREMDGENKPKERKRIGF